MSDPLVSVILPVYNNEATVEAAARSILRQTVQDLELIVIDDGSTDKSFAVVKQIRDPRIRLFRNEVNLGVSKARNRGLDCMRGAFMAPMDADDVCLPRRLELTLNVMQKDPAIGVCGGWALWKGWGPLAFVGRLPCGPTAVRAYLLYGSPYFHDTLLFRGKTLRRHGLRYPEHLRAAIDYDFYFRCAQVTGVANVPAVIVHYRFNPKGISNTRGQEATARRLEGLREELLRLFPDGVDDTTLRFHAKVGNGVGVNDRAELSEFRAWLEKLEEANRIRKAFDSQGLAMATAMVWFRICRNSACLGLPAWRAWRESPWAGCYHPDKMEIVGFFGSWALARVLPSRRRPQGQLTGL